MDINNAVAMLEGLAVLVQSMRTQFEIFEQKAKSCCGCVGC